MNTGELNQHSNGDRGAPEGVIYDPRLRWKVEAWLKAQERRRFHEQPAKAPESFEVYWKKVRYEAIMKGLIEALIAIAEIDRKKKEISSTTPPLALTKSDEPVQEVNPAAVPNRRLESRQDGKNMHITLIVTGDRGALVRESGRVENISRGGACVLSGQLLERGRYLQVITPVRKKSLMATVRESRSGPDQKAYLHLQFVNQQWPLESETT